MLHGLVLAAMLSSGGPQWPVQAALGDALGLEFARCADLDSPPDTRIAACKMLLSASGTTSMEEAAAYADLAAAFNAKADYVAANEALSRGIAIEPNYWVLYNNRILLLLKQQNIDAALDDFRKLAAIDPAKFALEHPDWRERLYSRERGLLKHQADIDERFNATLADMKQDLSTALRRRCVYRADNNDLDEAASDCDLAVSMAPELPAAHMARAYVEFRQQRYQQARDDLDQVLKTDSKDAAPFYLRFLVRLKQSDKGADEDRKAALALDPKVEESAARHHLQP
ncbi:MAG: hypothetical protein JOZ13_02395 [Alphaproteobacteria bacterium]|nr:hypothetical protein [Alphaproteobacteria bacterium]